MSPFDFSFGWCENKKKQLQKPRMDCNQNLTQPFLEVRMARMARIASQHFIQAQWFW